MIDSTAWVRCPVPAPKGKLPAGTLCRFAGTGRHFRMVAEFSVAEEEAQRGLMLQLPPGYRLEGSEVVREQECSRCERRFRASELDENVFHGERVCRACAGVDDFGDTPEHLKPLLRAARERVPGTVIDAREGWWVLWRPAPHYGYSGSESYLGEGFTNKLSGSFGRAELRDAIEQGRCYPTADARRIGREEFGMVFDGDVAARPIASASPVARDAPRCPCGATTNLRLVGIPVRDTDGSHRQDHRCGSCEQARRRAEIRAEMDRKLPKVARGVLRTWPPHSSGVSWED